MFGCKLLPPIHVHSLVCAPAGSEHIARAATSRHKPVSAICPRAKDHMFRRKRAAVRNAAPPIVNSQRRLASRFCPLSEHAPGCAPRPSVETRFSIMTSIQRLPADAVLTCASSTLGDKKPWKFGRICTRISITIRRVAWPSYGRELRIPPVFKVRCGGEFVAASPRRFIFRRRDGWWPN